MTSTPQTRSHFQERPTRRDIWTYRRTGHLKKIIRKVCVKVDQGSGSSSSSCFQKIATRSATESLPYWCGMSHIWLSPGWPLKAITVLPSQKSQRGSWYTSRGKNTVKTKCSSHVHGGNTVEVYMTEKQVPLDPHEHLQITNIYSEQ